MSITIINSFHYINSFYLSIKLISPHHNIVIAAMDPIQEIQQHLINKYDQFLRIQVIYSAERIQYKNKHKTPKNNAFSLDNYDHVPSDLDNVHKYQHVLCEFCDLYCKGIKYFSSRTTSNLIQVCPSCVEICENINIVIPFQNIYKITQQSNYLYVFKNDALFLHGEYMKVNKQYLINKIANLDTYLQNTYDEQFSTLFAERTSNLSLAIMIMREYTLDDIATYIARMLIETYPDFTS